VDIASSFNIPQTTAGQTVTLPAPTSTAAGRMIAVNNTGSTSLTVIATVVANGTSVIFVWNGSAWSPA
jgi:hypothetical protein